MSSSKGDYPKQSAYPTQQQPAYPTQGNPQQYDTPPPPYPTSAPSTGGKFYIIIL